MKYSEHLKLYTKSFKDTLKNRKLLIWGTISSYFELSVSLPYIVTVIITIVMITEWSYCYYSYYPQNTCTDFRDIFNQLIPFLIIAYYFFILCTAFFTNAFTKVLTIKENQKNENVKNTVSKVLKVIGATAIISLIFIPIQILIETTTPFLLALVLIGWIIIWGKKGILDTFKNYTYNGVLIDKQGILQSVLTTGSIMVKGKKETLYSIIINSKVNTITFLTNLIATVLTTIGTGFMLFEIEELKKSLMVDGLDIGVLLIVLTGSFIIWLIAAATNNLLFTARELYLNKLYAKSKSKKASD